MKVFFASMVLIAIGCGLYACLLSSTGNRLEADIQKADDWWKSDSEKGWSIYPSKKAWSTQPHTVVEAHSLVLSDAKLLCRNYDDEQSLKLIVTALLFFTSIAGWIACVKRQNTSPPPR